MRVCSIASGSSGNCIYVGTETTHILVDAGISCKRIREGVNQLDIDLSDLDGIFITHEHSDHIAGLKVLAKNYGIPIYSTPGTLNGIMHSKCVQGDMDESLLVPINADEKFVIKDITMHPLRVSHDANEPVAYRVYHGNKKLGIITDLGTYSDYTVASLQGMNMLYMEANHDVNMLQVGPYPYYLKQRILGNRGHLSNEAAGRMLCSLLHDKMEAVVLAHLSKENNMPELAYESVRLEVNMSDVPYTANDFPLYVAKRDTLSEMITL